MSSVTTDRTARPARPATFYDTTIRGLDDMYQADIRLAEIREHHKRLHSIRHGERSNGHRGSSRGRAIRHRLGETLMRLGRRIGGEALTDTLTTPAWQR